LNDWATLLGRSAFVILACRLLMHSIAIAAQMMACIHSASEVLAKEFGVSALEPMSPALMSVLVAAKVQHIVTVKHPQTWHVKHQPK
jgi:hypothetical protein